MSNPQQNEIQKVIEQIKKEINLYCLINLSKPKKKKESIAKRKKTKRKKKNKKKKRIYCKMDKSGSQKYKPKKGVIHRESQKCIIKYRIYFKMK